MTSPVIIDGATVIEWAWSDRPFGFVVNGDGKIAIHGIAIVAYDHKTYYRLSCDNNWETIQDSDYESINDAKRMLPDQYRCEPVTWNIL